MTNLYLLCGIPGSGKSTWAIQKRDELGGIIYSRDEIRFQYITNREEYFSCEDRVFDKYVSLINHAISSGINNVFADATQITEKSRNRLLDKLQGDFNIIVVYFNTNLEVCQERNASKEGLRVVPRGIVRRMFLQQVPPTMNEKYHYTEIIEVKE